MVYDSETFQILHKLTEEGKIHYQEILEQKATEILEKHNKPLLVRWFNYIFN